MSFSGRLEQIPLSHLLQIVASNRLSGKLTVSCRDGHGLLVFHQGKIVYAATNGARETFGNILLLRKKISASVLEEALERQGRSSVEQRLGSILLAMGAIDEGTLRDVLTEQVEQVLMELFRWHRGFLKFEAIEISRRGEVEVDATDFLIDEGLPTAQLVLEVLARLEEVADTGELERELSVVLADGEERPSDEIAPCGLQGPTLKSLMTEIRSPAFTGEITLGILRFAAQRIARGALFLHTSGQLTGMGQFGVDDLDEPADVRVRRIRIPADRPSVFFEVLERRELYRGPLERRFWNIELERALGGGTPREVVAIPMLVGDRVALVFYGDNLPFGGALPSLDDLELLMIQGGLAIEKAVLEKRLSLLQPAPLAAVSG